MKRVVADQMVSASEEMHKLITAYMTAVDSSDAVRVANELASLRVASEKRYSSKQNDGSLAKELVHFYTEISCPILQDATLEFLCRLKSNTQALTCLLQYWKVRQDSFSLLCKSFFL